MNTRVETGWLFDFYGPLLSLRQNELMKMWCEDDMSLSEIAEETGVSRQAVSSMLHAAQDHLTEYEEKLGLLARHRRLTEGLEECLALIRTDPSLAEKKIHELLNEEE